MATPYHAQFAAHALTLRSPAGSVDGLSRSLGSARVDLNPHQVSAALFANDSPLRRGVLLADEVGLGKTIEAGLVLAQRWAEGRRKLLLIVPATLRKQWQQELAEKFGLPSLVVDRARPPEPGTSIAICSYQYVASRVLSLQQTDWDLVVLDEAHRLRNIYRGLALGQAVLAAIREAPRILLTATPLQNSLMELYGLVSILDPHVFGDPESFRAQFARAGDEDARNEALRERMRPLCMRTLRRQVQEYVAFTRRVPIVQAFSPGDEEQALYEGVSALLRRPRLASMPQGQRALMTLVLRKLLASSTFAIAATLRKILARVVAGAPGDIAPAADFEALAILREEWPDQPSTATAAGDGGLPSQEEIAEEVQLLRQLVALGEHIRINHKGGALIQGLATALAAATNLGARRKAVVFTESRQTQRYLRDLLGQHGYLGQIVCLDGSNADPDVRAIYKRWQDRHRGDGTATGVRAVDVRAALVEMFRDEATILLATEAAAEGINLQFCSLVVNYDLPWNPQRVEQRIGRCHRYGQKHDVVVVNFVNERNAADQRVYDLLDQKFRLFSGVFGASDEVLGAVESGVDLEKRIAAVYQDCRTNEQIEAAFAALRQELDEQIQARMTQTREELLAHFDQEVTDRLRVHRDEARALLDRRGLLLRELTRFELDGGVQFEPGGLRFRVDAPAAHAGAYQFDWHAAEARGDAFYHVEHPLAASLIVAAKARSLPGGQLVIEPVRDGQPMARLVGLRGKTGWLHVARLQVDAMTTEEHLLVSACTDDGQALDEETSERLLDGPARLEASDAARPGQELDAAANAVQAHRLADVERRHAQWFDAEATKLDRWAEDLKVGLEREIKDLDRAIKEAQKQVRLAVVMADKLAPLRQVRDYTAERDQKRRQVYAAQDEIDLKRDGLIGQVEKHLQRFVRVELVFVVRWRVRE